MKILLFLLLIAQQSFADKLQITYIEHPPYYYTKDNTAHGYLYRKVEQICKDAKIEATFFSLPVKRAIRKVKLANKQNCSIGWFKTHKREKFANFSLPIYQNRPLVVIKKKKNIHKFKKYHLLKDIFLDKTLTTIMIDGFSYGSIVDKIIKENHPIVYTFTGNQKQLIKMLAKDRMTYFLVAPEEIFTLLKTNGLNPNDFVSFKLDDIPIGNKRYLMCSKNTPQATMNKLNNSIKKLIDLSSF